MEFYEHCHCKTAKEVALHCTSYRQKRNPPTPPEAGRRRRFHYALTRGAGAQGKHGGDPIHEARAWVNSTGEAAQ
jgi:hypothetical protein